MAKLNEQKKVELLEAAIATNDLEKIQALYTEHKNFEFTARALGKACRICTPDIVRALCENGATFNYECTAAMVKKYDCKLVTSNRDSFPKEYSRSIVVGRASEADPTESPASGDVRRRNLAVLWEYRDQVGLDAQEVLFHALLWQDNDLVQELKDLGVRTLTTYRADMASGQLPHNRLTSLGRYERRFFANAFCREPVLVNDFVMGFVDILGGESLHLFKSDITEYNSQKNKDVLITKLCNEAVFMTMALHTNLGEIANKRDILYALVEENNASGLVWALEQGWADEKDEKALLKYAQKLDNVAAPVMALLLNKNEPKEIDAESLFSTLSPSAEDMKKIWSTKKLEDGTLMITGYKGESVDVVIPDMIGKTPVTVLGPDIFNPSAPRITRVQAEARLNLRSIEIPGSFGSVPKNLFGCVLGCYQWTLPNLKQVVLGEGIKVIGEGAFMGCTGLEEVILPQSLTSLEYGAFYNCTALKELYLPQSVTQIGICAFYNCYNLLKIHIPANVCTIGYGDGDAFYSCEHVTIFGTSGSYAETYAKYNNIPFVAE